MTELKTKLETFVVLRDITMDPVLRALGCFFARPSSATYARFVSVLYSANGGNLSEHIAYLLRNSDNIYVRTVGCGGEPAPFMREALENELAVLSEIASLTPDMLRSQVEYDGFLPSFANSKLALEKEYFTRLENIKRYGYGIYASNSMFYINDSGRIVPVKNPDITDIDDLVDYSRERDIIIANTRALLDGKPAANILLTGDAGTGKSSTVKAVGALLFRDGLRIIEVRKDQLRAIPKILDELAVNPLKFVLFIDDLSFMKNDDNFNALKAVLEGSVSARSKNVVIYATSNRRHIVKESFSDRDGDDIHRGETMQETVSLSERFGIHISFSKPDKRTYLHIVRSLAEKAELSIPEDELEAGAERLALERGGRSARLARQYVDSLLAR